MSVDQCLPISIEACRHFGHLNGSVPSTWGATDVETIQKQYLYLVDPVVSSGCSEVALFYACAMLFPRCDDGVFLYPCRSVCEGEWLLVFSCFCSFKGLNRNFQSLTSVLFCKLECCAVSCSPDLNIYSMVSTEYDSKCRNAPRFFPQNCSLLPDKATDGECLQPPSPIGKELLLALLAFRKPSINFLE